MQAGRSTLRVPHALGAAQLLRALTVTFSIRLTEVQHATLEFLTERFGDSKSAVAQKLRDAAMEDAMRSVGSLEVGRERHGISPDEANRVIDAKEEGYRRDSADL